MVFLNMTFFSITFARIITLIFNRIALCKKGLSDKVNNAVCYQHRHDHYRALLDLSLQNEIIITNILRPS